MYKILVYGRGFSPDPHRQSPPGGDFENPRGHGVLPEGIFKIPERAMGIWGKSTTINQNFVHIFFLILSDIKTFPLYILSFQFKLIVFYKGVLWPENNNCKNFPILQSIHTGNADLGAIHNQKMNIFLSPKGEFFEIKQFNKSKPFLNWYHTP